jgi:hypothetical protein
MHRSRAHLTKAGGIDVSESNTVSAQLESIAAGAGYSLTLQGRSTVPSVAERSGSATFAISGGEVTTVPVAIACHVTDVRPRVSLLLLRPCGSAAKEPGCDEPSRSLACSTLPRSRRWLSSPRRLGVCRLLQPLRPRSPQPLKSSSTSKHPRPSLRTPSLPRPNSPHLQPARCALRVALRYRATSQWMQPSSRRRKKLRPPTSIARPNRLPIAPSISGLAPTPGASGLPPRRQTPNRVRVRSAPVDRSALRPPALPAAYKRDSKHATVSSASAPRAQ